PPRQVLLRLRPGHAAPPVPRALRQPLLVPADAVGERLAGAQPDRRPRLRATAGGAGPVLAAGRRPAAGGAPPGVPRQRRAAPGPPFGKTAGSGQNSRLKVKGVFFLPPTRKPTAGPKSHCRAPRATGIIPHRGSRRGGTFTEERTTPVTFTVQQLADLV